MRGYAEAFDIAPVALKAALMDIDMPGTRGASKLLTSAQADQFVTKISEVGDKEDTDIAPLIKALKAKQSDVDALFDTGGLSSLKAAMTAFYAKTDVATLISAKKDALANHVWINLYVVGSSKAVAWYSDSSGGY